MCCRGSEASPFRGVPRGETPLGDSLVTFSSGRKSPGARGGAPAHGEECRGRGAAPPRIGVCRGAQPLARFEAEARGEKGGKYKREEPNGSSLLS